MKLGGTYVRQVTTVLGKRKIWSDITFLEDYFIYHANVVSYDNT